MHIENQPHVCAYHRGEGMKAWYIRKAGGLRNGFGADGGRINHIYISDKKHSHLEDEALCGARPRVFWDNHWTEEPTGKVCPKCARKMEALA